MRTLFFILFTVIFVSLTSCRQDFDTVPSSGTLEFSSQTVYLDTIFTDIGSSTYLLKVYNRSSNDITIPSIRLAKGNSKYRMMVDGSTGNDADQNGQGDGRFFPNVEVLAKDSLFIFIETTANIADTDVNFTYNDQILFDSGNNQQAVDLITLIQDAYFIFPNREFVSNIKETLTFNGSASEIFGHTLKTDAELHWTNEKPYVVYGYALVPAGKKLIIDAGARVHFHADSGIIVEAGASIEINGTAPIFGAEGAEALQNEVIFEGDRLEPSFAETPGQWGWIWIFSGGPEINTINHLTIKNAGRGIWISKITADYLPKLFISNSKIYNSSNHGILGEDADIIAENLVISNAGQACFAGTFGGNYLMTHCTFNNNFQNTSQVAVLLDNYFVENGDQKAIAMNARFYNSIIYGTNQVELLMDFVNGNAANPLNFDFQNCLIKFNDFGTAIQNDPNYNFIRTPVNGNIKSVMPNFYNANNNNLRIGTDSPAFGAGNATFTTNGNTDLLGILRTGTPDLGAYKAIDLP